MKRLIIIVGVISVFGLLLAGCAQGFPQTVTVVETVVVEKEVAAEEAPPEPVELSMWYFNWPPGYQYQEERVRIYTQENPHVTIDFDHSIPPVGEGGFEDKVTSALATGTGPDIFAVINPQAIKLINKGQLAPVDDAAIEALGFDSVEDLKASRMPGAFDSWSNAEGVPYGYHWELSWLVLYCNDEHLRAAGVDPDTVEIETWEDFIELGKQVIEGNPEFYKTPFRGPHQVQGNLESACEIGLPP